jgi:hypothetical protein
VSQENVARPASSKMFFFFVGGLESRVVNVLQKNLGPCVIVGCNGRVELAEVASSFYVFFIPVYDYGHKQVVRCEQCGYLATPEQYEQHRSWLKNKAMETVKDDQQK